MKKRTAIIRNALVFGLFLFVVMLAGCSGAALEPDALPTAVPEPTTAPTAPAPTPSDPADESQTETAEAQPTDDAPEEIVEAEPTEVVQAIPDPQRGREIFTNGGADEFYKPEMACVTCHSLDGTVRGEDTSGPSLLGLADRAAERVPGLSAEEYIRQSIMVPAEFLTPTYRNGMTRVAADLLIEEEIEDLMAFLLSLSGETVSAADIMPTPEVDIDLAMQIEEGNPKRGEVLTGVVHRCVGCHVDEEITGYGPRFSSSDKLPPISERGELRIADPEYSGQATTNQEYMIESIFLPAVYIVPGEWADTMPNAYHEFLSEQELADIMAWLNTFE